MCGPPPPPDPTGAHNPTATQAPIADMVMDDKQQNCTTSAQGPVRVSVKLSEAWAAQGATDSDEGRDRARWVRDGEK
jgi:hypothetical protein